MNNQLTLEIYRQGKWQTAATFKVDDITAGYRGSSLLNYDVPYAAENIQQAEAAGLSARFPANFDFHQLPTWPAFILDILPSGAGRTHWLKRLELDDGAGVDWPLLLTGTAFPPGNVRVAEAAAQKDLDALAPKASGEQVAMHAHPGFTTDEILDRQEYFIEYVYENGAQTAGASDVQGAAPKFLLTKDHQGRWHAEGVLSDDQISSYWLVKFPRGRKSADRKVLKNEAAYMAVAQQLGFKVNSKLMWENDTLFIPRFDRRKTKNELTDRLGMESLCSLAGVCNYGVNIPHETLSEALATFSTDPQTELIEYLLRDVINVVLGNKDNHARNTAVHRFEDGRVTLTPLFDFAPMYLDPEGIARVCRWAKELESAGQPDWAAVMDHLSPVISATSVDANAVKVTLRDFGQKLLTLPDIMRSCGVDDDIIEFRTPSIEANANQLIGMK
ncbi:MAG: HipA domain-containing protein [Pseudomonadales bacterium]|nr:HipA domain-containing protein [Pseudomonadales bacterium]